MDRPIITCGAILRRNNKILLTKRNVPPFENHWCLPGGHIEKGETVKQAMKREVKEETGLDFSPKFVGYWDEIIPSIEWHAVVLVFEGSFRGKIIPQKSEVKEIKWFSEKEIKNLSLAFFHKEILEKYFYAKKIQKKHL